MMTRRHFRFFVFYPFAIITALIVMLWIATPFVAKYALKQFVEQQGNEAKIERLSVDFFPPRVEVKNLVFRDTEQETFSVKKAAVEIAFWPLFSKRLHVTDANIESLKINATQRENEWILAGINTTQYFTQDTQNRPQESEPDEPKSQTQSTAWSIKLPSFSLLDSQIDLSRQTDLAFPAKTDTLKIDRISLEKIVGQGLDWQGQLAFSGGINNATLAFNSQFEYSPTQANGHFELEEGQFTIDSLRHFLPAPLNAGDGVFSVSGRTTLAQTSLSGDLMQFSLRDLELSMQATQLDAKLDDKTRIASADTKVQMKNSQLSYRTDNTFSTEGDISIESAQTDLVQQKNQVKFDQFSLSSPYDIQHSNENSAINVDDTELSLNDLLVVFDDVRVDSKALNLTTSFELNNQENPSVNGDVMVEAEQTKIFQRDNQLAFELLNFSLPIVLQRNESLTELDVSKTQLLLTNMVANFNDATVENKRLDAVLKNLSASLHSDGTMNADFLSEIDTQGFTFSQPAAENANHDTPTTAAFDKLAFSSPITLEQGDLGLNVNTHETQLNVDALAVSSAEFDVENQLVNLTLDDLTVFIDQDNSLAASATTHLRSQALRLNQAGNRVRYQDFTLSSNLAIQQNIDTVSVQNSQFALRLDDFDAVLNDEKALTFKDIHLTADALNIDQNAQQPLLVNGSEVEVSTERFDIKLSEEKRLASWNKASINDLSFRHQAQDFSVSFTQFDMENLTLSEVLTLADTSSSLPPLGHIGHITIEQLNATQEGAEIEQITLDTLKANLLFNENQQLDNLVSQEAEASVEKGDAEQSNRSEQPLATESSLELPYYVILKALDTTGDSSIYLQDESIPATLQRTLSIEALSVRDLNTQNKDQATLFSVMASHGKYTKLKADTMIWPLAEKLTLNTDIVLREAELPPYSPYISNVLGYQIDSGQLDLDLTLDIDDGILKGESRIFLRELDLGGRQESNSVVRAGAVPLNIAVGILKDSNNNIDLDIPLSGDIDNPSFGWQDFLFLPLKKALYSASTSYLMQTFVPYANVISVAQFAGEQLLRIRVEPLIFNATQSEFSDANTEFLAQLTALMKDKKDSQLKACGVASFQDVAQEQPSSVLDDDTRAFAINLAQQRAENLKDFLVSEGIESSRVFLCSPEVDLSRDSQPRVELNF